MNNLNELKKKMPVFPSTPHLDIQPNKSLGDTIIEVPEWNHRNILITEKIDGANMRIAIIDDIPYIGNRTHILNKAYKINDRPAQQQFKSVWSWLYDKKNYIIENIRKIESLLNTNVTIYGEWVVAKHTISYDFLPDRFIAYDIYDSREEKFLDPPKAYEMLFKGGFTTPQVLLKNEYVDDNILKGLRDRKSSYIKREENNLAEGIYISTGDGRIATGRYKMVTEGFKSNDNWNSQPLKKNTIVGSRQFALDYLKLLLGDNWIEKFNQW